MKKTRRTLEIPVNPSAIINFGNGGTDIKAVMVYYYSEKEEVSRTDIATKEKLTKQGYYRVKYRRAPGGKQVFVLGAKAEMIVTIGKNTYVEDISETVKEYNDEDETLSPTAFKKMAHAINKGKKKKDQLTVIVSM